MEKSSVGGPNACADSEPNLRGACKPIPQWRLESLTGFLGNSDGTEPLVGYQRAPPPVRWATERGLSDASTDTHENSHDDAGTTKLRAEPRRGTPARAGHAGFDSSEALSHTHSHTH